MLARLCTPAIVAVLAVAPLRSQTGTQPPAPNPGPNHDLQQTAKAIDDVAWRLMLGDIAEVDKVTFTSSPPWRVPNQSAPGAANPLVIAAYTYIPKNLDRSRKQPLIVYAHGGVHASFSSGQSGHIVREMVRQGYSVIAADYRGSTDYGREFSERIDYGGREVDDVDASRAWMLESYPFLDPKRVGMVGWSHGGLITLMNIFEHPSDYAAAYAGVPVSDLVARLGYENESYRQFFSAPYHIGKSVREDIQEYRRRSPVNHVDKLQTPLLVHTNTNDEDVNVLEVEHLIDALKAAGKKFEYKIYQNAPGGHLFNRLDTPLARESRAEVWRFLARYLQPSNPVR